MIKAILGIVGLLAGLGVAIYFLYPGKPVETPADKPPQQTQAAVDPKPEATQKPAATTPQPSTVPEPTPPAAGPAAPPAVVPVPTPEAPQVEKPLEKPVEKKAAPAPPLQPQKEHGLVVGNFRRYRDAQRRLDKIKKKNLPGFIRKEGKYYQVWAGPFATPREAEQARKSLRTAYKISPQRRDYVEPVPK